MYPPYLVITSTVKGPYTIRVVSAGPWEKNSDCSSWHVAATSRAGRLMGAEDKSPCQAEIGPSKTIF